MVTSPKHAAPSPLKSLDSVHPSVFRFISADRYVTHHCVLQRRKTDTGIIYIFLKLLPASFHPIVFNLYLTRRKLSEIKKLLSKNVLTRKGSSNVIKLQQTQTHIIHPKQQVYGATTPGFKTSQDT